MKIIPVIVDHLEPYQASKEANRIWENYRNVRGNFHKHSIAVYQRFGTACPANGCGNCSINDCFFSEFIHRYWKCPNGE